MARTKDPIPTTVRPGLTPGSIVGGVVEGIKDVSRALLELKRSSDDMAVVEAAALYSFSGIRVTRTNALTVATSTFITFENTIFAAGGWTRSGDSIIVPAGVTRCLITGTVQWAASSLGNREACIFRNSVGIQALSRMRATVAGETSVFVSSGIFEVAAGQFLQLRAVQDTGSNLDILPGVTSMSVYALG